MRRPISSLQSFHKRTFDIVVAIAGLLMFSPLILLISLWIRIESPGPVLCRHKRYSANNTECEVFEFRTTLADRRANTTEQNRPDDIQCITRFGRILRSSGVSKLPHLISVLSGELSIVGTHLFTNAPGESFSSLDMRQAKPGLVTWALASEDRREIMANIDRCIDCDRLYIENSSFLFDMKTLFYTLFSKTTYL